MIIWISKFELRISCTRSPGPGPLANAQWPPPENSKRWPISSEEKRLVKMRSVRADRWTMAFRHVETWKNNLLLARYLVQVLLESKRVYTAELQREELLLFKLISCSYLKEQLRSCSLHRQRGETRSGVLKSLNFRLWSRETALGSSLFFWYFSNVKIFWKFFNKIFGWRRLPGNLESGIQTLCMVLG